MGDKKGKGLVHVDEARRTHLAGKAFGYRLDGMPVEEIARELDITPEEVAALVTIAHGRLSVQSGRG